MAVSKVENAYGEIVLFSHPPRNVDVLDSAAAVPTLTQIATEYLRIHREELGLSDSDLADTADAIKLTRKSKTPLISYLKEKTLVGASVVVFQQSVFGLPVFEARLGVHIDQQTLNVLSVQSSFHARIRIENPDAIRIAKYPVPLEDRRTVQLLNNLIRHAVDMRINQQLIYRFEPAERLQQHHADHGGGFSEHKTQVEELPTPTIDLKQGTHYIVDEVLFSAPLVASSDVVNWRALIEPNTSNILYLRPLVAYATGLVFDRDPQTTTGANVTAGSSNAVLNPFRTSVALKGLLPSVPQSLTSDFVTIADFVEPDAAPPRIDSPVGEFSFDVRTDEFSAVNAFHHCDRLFRTMQDFGFDVRSYFGGTSFPVPVDHRAVIGSSDGNEVNASAPGNSIGNGLKEFRFALAQENSAVGMATSARVVWHEFGHAILWDQVDSPNFGFAHSAGDAMAAIVYDPGSASQDRFSTFPWIAASNPGLSRRHDRAVADGWAWNGPNYNVGYGGEQVLSSTLFRFYQSIGGDSARLNDQLRASNAALFLILKSVGLLTSMTPYTQVYVQALQDADYSTRSFKGIVGGALHKVIRWSFEKQGLFQSNDVPFVAGSVVTEGLPPEVDVYIDDGRAGEYAYLAKHWACEDIWVRHSNDDEEGHQQPIVGVVNYLYVKVKNRGLNTALNVSVDAFHALPGTGLSFPSDWRAMQTPRLNVGDSIAPGGEKLVGPFEFVPAYVSHENLLAIVRADGDDANDASLMGSIPEHRCVAFDNNIAQRNVSLVYPSTIMILAMFNEHEVWVRNPFRHTVVATVQIELPKILRSYGWRLRILSEGAAEFELGPNSNRKVVFSLIQGDELAHDDVRHAIAKNEATIEFTSLLDGELSGGIDYPLSFQAAQTAIDAVLDV